MKKQLPKTLAERVQYLREKVDISRERLAELSNIQSSEVSDIEEGRDTFLSPAVRQRLAKALRVPATCLKEVEKKKHSRIDIPQETIELIKDSILSGNLKNNLCPLCESKLICRIVTMYDLENNPVYHAKAHCSKCPFQIS